MENQIKAEASKAENTEQNTTLLGVRNWADYEARANSILAEYGKGTASRYQSARVIAASEGQR